MDVRGYNRSAWDSLVSSKNRWTTPVDDSTIAKAKQGSWSIVLTPTLPVPHTWFPPLAGCRVLGLAAGGGQQCPILAAAGASVTLLDNSPKQLAQDQALAQQHNLSIATIEGDMADLSMLGDASFDLIVHPCSNCFVPDINPVWQECYRILESGGTLMAGMVSPMQFIFNPLKLDKGEFEVRHTLPYSDVDDLSEQERQHYVDQHEPLVFGHTLDDQIGGQLRAGFSILEFYEDRDPQCALSQYIPTAMATRAFKCTQP